MATIAYVGSPGFVQVSTDTNTYTTGSFTPGTDDLLVVVVGVTGSTSTDWAVSGSAGGTWTKIRRQLKATSADIMEVWVRDSLSAATSQTVTYSHASGNATGCNLIVYKITGMTKTGATAIRSQGGQDNQASSTPAPALDQAALTDNCCLTVVHNGTVSGLTVPSGWGTNTVISYTTPTTGFNTSPRNSGFTGTTVTWGSSSASAFSSVAVEFDTSAGGETDFVGMIPL